jgi:hypothetical protein
MHASMLRSLMSSFPDAMRIIQTANYRTVRAWAGNLDTTAIATEQGMIESTAGTVRYFAAELEGDALKIGDVVDLKTGEGNAAETIKVRIVGCHKIGGTVTLTVIDNRRGMS